MPTHSDSSAVDEDVNKFRLASRDLYNRCFRSSDRGGEEPWLLEERFAEVEVSLFQALVARRQHPRPFSRYGEAQAELRVRLRSQHARIMINREPGAQTGYWDFPLVEVEVEAELLFVRFFDWDALGIRDGRYVMVLVAGWPSQPQTVGRFALLQSDVVSYERREA